jgi:hypothetical protein
MSLEAQRDGLSAVSIAVAAKIYRAQMAKPLQTFAPAARY